MPAAIRRDPFALSFAPPLSERAKAVENGSGGLFDWRREGRMVRNAAHDNMTEQNRTDFGLMRVQSGENRALSGVSAASRMSVEIGNAVLILLTPKNLSLEISRWGTYSDFTLTIRTKSLKAIATDALIDGTSVTVRVGPAANAAAGLALFL